MVSDEKRGEQFDEFPPDFVPNRDAPKRSNKDKVAMGCGAAVLAVLGLGVIGAIVGDPPADNATAPINASAPSEPVPVKDDAQAPKRALIAQYRRMLAVAQPCDAALAGLKAATDRAQADGNVLQLMSATAAGQNVCATAAGTIKDMSAPAGLAAKPAATLNNALRSCFRGYDRREQAFTRATNALAGEATDLSEAVDDIERSRGDVIACVAGMIGAAAEAGIDLKEMQ